MFTIKKVIQLGVIITLFTACGGGEKATESSINNKNISTNIKNVSGVSNSQYGGVLIDSLVSGARYVCDNGKKDAFTSVKGEFECSSLPIDFYVGKLHLGEIQALPTDNEIHIQDLFMSIDRNNTLDERVIKIARLLQSLDSDKNASNGIEISPVRNAYFQNEIEIEDFNLSKLQEYDKTIKTVSKKDAIDHLKENNNFVVSTDDNTVRKILLERKILQGSDDAEERLSNGKVKLNSSDLELVEDKSAQIVGLRFTNISIPRNATVTHAYLQFQTDERSSVATNLTIYGEVSANALTFTSETANISKRVKSKISVDWTPSAWDTLNERGVNQQSSEIKSIVQELVNQEGWSNGNAMVFMIEGSGKRVAESMNGSATGAPRLYVEYTISTTPVTDNEAPKITLKGENPTVLELGKTYVEAGAEVKDNIDTNLELTIVGNVDTLTEGNYTISYSAKDSADNLAIKTRMVSVVSKPEDGIRTIELRVSSSKDDAEETVSTGAMKLGSSDLELINDKSEQLVGLRFKSFNIPKKSTIIKAYLQFQVDEKSSGMANLVIHGEKSDNASIYRSKSHNISHRLKTVSSVNWSPENWSRVGEQGAAQQSSDLSSVIQELIDQDTWKAGNSVAFIISGTGKRVAESFNGVANAAPLLHIEYSKEVKTLPDTEAPIVTLNGDSNMRLLLGDDYYELGATVTDNVDKNLSIDITGDVNSSTLGTYRLKYQAVDNAGNSASTIREVTVYKAEEEKIVYEDGEDETIAGWTIYDNDPIGATIRNVYDTESGNRVIKLNGAGKSNAYQLGRPTGTGRWNNKIDRVIEWSMNISETFKVYVAVKTNNGTRYLCYTHNDEGGSHNGKKKSVITHGLGATAKNGTWQTFRRDLVADLTEYDEDSTIESVNAFRVYGSGEFDNIQMLKTPTPNDTVAPILILNGEEILNIALDSNYSEAGVMAVDEVIGKVEVVVDGVVNTSQAGTYVLTYTATDRAGNSSSVSRTVNVTAVNLDNVSIILNEYNAVESNESLKSNGEDAHFGQVVGNGGSWMEMVVVGEHVDLRGARLTIKSEDVISFEGIFPNENQFGHLRRGTIITLSNEPTDMSYAPFNPKTGDWTLNLSHLDLNEMVGTFEINSSAMSMEIIADGKGIMVESGEHMVNVEIDTKEVFKLRKDPSQNITPIESDYGDDIDQKGMSSFGSANSWMDENGQLHTQDFSHLRANRDLEEIGGMALFNNPELIGLRDPESLLYIPQNNTLWISDDNAHKVYEMDLTSNQVKNIYTNQMLEDFSGVCLDENGTSIPDCKGLTDLESIVYDDINDTLYIFSGKASSIASIFKLTRPSTDDTFVFDDEDNTTRDYRILGSHEYEAAQFVEGKMIIAIENVLYAYDFETDIKTEVGFETSRVQGHIYGMAYDGSDAIWLITSNNYLLKIDWASKRLVASYRMSNNLGTKTYNGVYDTRGLEIINNKLYILEGMNNVGKKGAVEAPYGNALKAAVHIYMIPPNNL